MWGGVETNLLRSIGCLRLAKLVENGRDERGGGAFAFCAGDVDRIESVEIRWLRGPCQLPWDARAAYRPHSCILDIQFFEANLPFQE